MDSKTVRTTLAVLLVLFATRAQWTPLVLDLKAKPTDVETVEHVDQSELLGRVSRLLSIILPERDSVDTSGKLFDVWESVVDTAFDGVKLEDEIAKQIDSVWEDMKVALKIGHTQSIMNGSDRSEAAAIFSALAEANGY